MKGRYERYGSSIKQNRITLDTIMIIQLLSEVGKFCHVIDILVLYLSLSLSIIQVSPFPFFNICQRFLLGA